MAAILDVTTSKNNTCEQCGEVPRVIEVDYGTQVFICWIVVQCKCGKLTGGMRWDSVKE